jgi:hypothetical protein
MPLQVDRLTVEADELDAIVRSLRLAGLIPLGGI